MKHEYLLLCQLLKAQPLCAVIVYTEPWENSVLFSIHLPGSLGHSELPQSLFIMMELYAGHYIFVHANLQRIASGRSEPF